MNEHLVVPVVNSIDCVLPKIDISQWPEPRTFDDDPELCRKLIGRLGGAEPFCEEKHGCICDTCAREYLACDADPDCRDYFRCSLDGHRVSGWYLLHCPEAPDVPWDPFSSPVSLVSAIYERADCPSRCPGE